VADVPAVASGRGVVVVERGALGGAASRRSVPNLGEVAAAVATVADGPLVMLGETPAPPRDQIAAHTSARVLVGQHGAGLANMIWMPAGSTVVELLPPLNRQVRTIYRELAAVLGHSYTTVPQESAHASVDASAVVAALRRRPAPVPQTAGVRMRREAFRAGKLAEERLRRAPLTGSVLRRLT
jgi:capsular polysaccharide biosynthesis protein